VTPERWRRIDDLFDVAIRLDPSAREAWLRGACGADDGLRAEVGRLLAQDDLADRDGFLTPPEAVERPSDRTRDWPRVRDFSHPGEFTAIDRAETDRANDPSCFSPKAAIAVGSGPFLVSETSSVVRSRLRELPMIYILMLGIAIFWRHAIVRHAIQGYEDLALYQFDAVVIAGLMGLTALLWSRRPIPLAWLKALEFGMICILACRVAFVEYRLILVYSLRDDPMLAQLTMKNMVLLTSIIILTYGLYVPKSWRRVALVVVPLALLPFVTLAVLALKHPDAMRWLWEGWRKSTTPRYHLFTLDAMILLMLAVVSTFGARAISRLRRQVAEARQLGQYRLRGLIGSGGMGEVYLAEHQLLKRPCALKLIRPGAVADRNALERFEREVQITATLSHPNTVEVFDYGRTEDGTYYYVMEYLPGLSLEDLVERHGPLPPARAVYLLRQVCMALGEAHAAGLIHRDIKPSNIFAARRGGMDDVAKLLDFGLVRPAVETHAAHISEDGQILGTPLFMSPEQATGDRELDERSDIYSLGAVAYFLLTGRPPFDEASGIGVLIAHARDPVVPPSLVRTGIPEDLELVVLRCLAKHPAERFPDAERMELALGECECVGGWDPMQASRWWRGPGRAMAIPTIVT
jgi:eukaryotic-like serine/threonine-protein kinase